MKKFKSIQIWVVGLQDWESWEPVTSSIFKWKAKRIAKKLRGTEELSMGVNNYTIKQIPLLVIKASL